MSILVSQVDSAQVRSSEKLQLLPEQLDTKISDKHFLSAIDVLHEASKMIKKSELENVGALTDLRVYFDNQESVSMPTRRWHRLLT